MKNTRTTLIVGGVAGGATVAARLSRLDARRRIVIIERGDHVSFANCGLPYYIGGVIAEASSLLLASPELFRSRYGIEVKTGHEAVSIDTGHSTLLVRNLQSGAEEAMPYDELVLAPGASPFRPPMPGIDLEDVMTLRNIPDAEHIRSCIRERGVKRALVIGGGFIGLEVAENLHELGIEVHLAEGAPHILPPLDGHMARYVDNLLASKGIKVTTNLLTKGIRRTDRGALQAYTDTWESPEVDMVFLSIGIRPENALAKTAGLEIGPTGGILVDEHMRCSRPGIWAVGDAVEVRSRITQKPMLLALAGIAQKQARIAADSIAGRESHAFPGVLGSSVLRLFGTTVAMTGMNVDMLRRLGYEDEYEYVDGHASQHVSWYPGASPIHLRLVYRKRDGLILGATAIGRNDAARRIDVIAALMGKGGTVFDLEEAELCYSPQEGAAKDAVNQIGMAAANNLRGLHPIAHVEDIGTAGTFLLDVREEAEVRHSPFAGATNIPLSQLRQRWSELPTDKRLLVFCQSGIRSYNATRLLCNHGLDARNLSGGYISLSLEQAKD